MGRRHHEAMRSCARASAVAVGRIPSKYKHMSDRAQPSRLPEPMASRPQRNRREDRRMEGPAGRACRGAHASPVAWVWAQNSKGLARGAASPSPRPTTRNVPPKARSMPQTAPPLQFGCQGSRGSDGPSTSYIHSIKTHVPIQVYFFVGTRSGATREVTADPSHRHPLPRHDAVNLVALLACGAAQVHARGLH